MSDEVLSPPTRIGVGYHAYAAWCLIGFLSPPTPLRPTSPLLSLLTGSLAPPTGVPGPADLVWGGVPPPPPPCRRLSLPPFYVAPLGPYWVPRPSPPSFGGFPPTRPPCFRPPPPPWSVWVFQDPLGVLVPSRLFVGGSPAPSLLTPSVPGPFPAPLMG